MPALATTLLLGALALPLAAGLPDERVALTMPMSSGIQGLGPYRSGLGRFVDQAENLPFGAHTVAAALAPRALVVDQGTADPFVNSKGTSKILLNQTITKDYSDLGSYGSPMAAAFPWATAIPGAP
ncbi:hypothetical protein DL771_007302 [Monosporascus sp. 5C6A]|nr:hypothetical protein DL771_007302 [Monosporascus sp. 5C6A]